MPGSYIQETIRFSYNRLNRLPGVRRNRSNKQRLDMKTTDGLLLTDGRVTSNDCYAYCMEKAGFGVPIKILTVSKLSKLLLVGEVRNWPILVDFTVFISVWLDKLHKQAPNFLLYFICD